VKNLVAEGLTAEVLLCPGDLADSKGGVDTAGMEYAWRELQLIATGMGGAKLIATAGNHDIERPPAPPATAPSGYDPGVHLKGLTPEFPTTIPSDHVEYFAEDFIVVRTDRWRVVALNSCAEQDVDHLRGSVRQSTIDHIQAVLEDDGDPPPINLFMCHHHPVEWTHLAPEDTSHMRQGQHLLRMLDLVDSSRWVFLHGHRHQPTIGYAGESTSGPVRFSAGSLSCTPYQDQGAVRNQFYLLEFDIDELARLNLPGAGRFHAWDWRYRRGLRPAARDSGIPHHGGFGFRRDAHELAAQCRQLATATGVRKLTWRDLLNHDERWAYVAPSDLQALKTELPKIDADSVFGDDGILEEVSINGNP
jgi:hypothetical protein